MALNAALAPKYVGLHTLYKDMWHPCVPLVPATYVSLLPLMAVMRLRRRFKDDYVFGSFVFGSFVFVIDANSGTQNS